MLGVDPCLIPRNTTSPSGDKMKDGRHNHGDCQIPIAAFLRETAAILTGLTKFKLT